VVEAEGYKSASVHVIHNGIDLERPFPTREDARRSLGLAAHAPVLLIVANLRPLKRAEDAVAALPTIRARFPTAELVLVGSDDDGRYGPSHVIELRCLAARLGVESAIRLVGEVADPRPYIAAAD